MKLHLPTTLRAALPAVVAADSAAYDATTYGDLATPDYFNANKHVYNTGKGTFYPETPSCDLNLTLTLNLKALEAYQGVHDYANGGNYSPFVTWTYNNNSGSNYGGVSSAKVGKEYNADTYVMMMGTNDILSDDAYNDTNMPKVTERLLGVGEVRNGKWVNGDVTSALIGAQGTDPATATLSLPAPAALAARRRRKR